MPRCNPVLCIRQPGNPLPSYKCDSSGPGSKETRDNILPKSPESELRRASGWPSIFELSHQPVTCIVVYIICKYTITISHSALLFTLVPSGMFIISKLLFRNLQMTGTPANRRRDFYTKVSHCITPTYPEVHLTFPKVPPTYLLYTQHSFVWVVGKLEVGKLSYFQHFIAPLRVCLLKDWWSLSFPP